MVNNPKTPPTNRERARAFFGLVIGAAGATVGFGFYLYFNHVHKAAWHQYGDGFNDALLLLAVAVVVGALVAALFLVRWEER